MTSLGNRVQELVTESDTVLDLGCGIMLHTRADKDGPRLKCKSILGMDAWRPYLENIKRDFPVIHGDLTRLDSFLDESFDVVLLLDVLEHLTENEALKVLDEAKRIAHRKVIGLTPKAFDSNHQQPGGAWGLGDNPLQEHLSVIAHEEFVLRKYSVETFESGHFFTWNR